MSSPRDTLDDVRFSELVSEGSDIPAVADRLKSIAAAEREMGRETTVDELLAQSRRNDAAYLMPSDIEKAEWVADLCTNAKIARTNTRETFTTGWW